MAGFRLDSGFSRRAISGLAGAAALLVLAWNRPWHTGFAFVVLVVLLLALAEFYGLAVRLGFEPDKAVGLVLGGLLLWNALHLWAEQAPLVSGAGTVLTLVYLAGSVLKGEAYLGFSRLAATFLGLAYVVGLGGWIGRFVERGNGNWIFQSEGHNDLPPLLLLTWVFDSAAMLSGCAWGRRKLSLASPNKSWEGVAGGFLAILVLALVLPWMGLWEGLTCFERVGAALVIAPAAILGDLVESALKREAVVKDSATLAFLPGHGGFLDKVDALLFTAPVLALYLQWVR